MLEDFGIPHPHEGWPVEINDEANMALAEICATLVRCEITPPYHHWITWTLTERAAFVEAKERFRAISTTDNAMAHLGGDSLAAVRSRADEGDMQLGLALSRQCARIAEMSGKHARS